MVRKSVMHHLIVIVVACACLYMIRASLISKEIAIRTQDKLDRSLVRYEVAVLLLYDRHNCSGSLVGRSLQKALTLFREVSRDKYFRYAGLQFLAVEVGGQRFAAQVCDEWQVEQLPAIIICDQGQAVTNSRGQVNALYTLTNRAGLVNFIQETIGDQLEYAIQQKDADRKRRLEEARIQFYESPVYPLEGDYAGDYGWAYPYWGYGYGYPYGAGGYMGVGIGFGL